MRKLTILLVPLCLLAQAGSADADLMAIWDFGPNAAGYTLNVTTENVIDVPTMSASGADYDLDGKDGRAFTDAEGTFHNAGQAVAWDDVSGTTSDAEWIMTINTIGWKDMTIRWDYISDNTGGKKGPTSFDFDYKVGDGSWINILNNETIVRDDGWHEFSLDLSSITAIEGQTTVQFRVNDLNRNDDNGDYKFDNLQLTGVPAILFSLLVPNGGEQLVAGMTYTIRWESSPTIAQVFIEYSTNNGSSWTAVDPPNSGNTGSYDWLVPEVTSPDCLVRISDADSPTTNDTSDDVFTIFQCQGPIVGDLNGDCYVDFLDLAIFAISWLQCGNPFDPACGL